jgi:hypothetical protein
MGQSTNGILAYGYNIGSDEGGWKLEGAGEYGEMPTVEWFDPEAEDGDGFEESAERHMLADIGFTERWTRGNDGYFDREKAAKARLGVEFESYCSGEYPMYLLAAKGSVTTARRGDCEPVDFTVNPDWDAKLRAALQVLGITPTQERAQWLLCSYWC